MLAAVHCQMPELTHCPKCGARLSPGLLGEACTNCARQAAFELATRAGPASTITGKRFGDYELLEEIARGGMGVIYRAHQISLNRTVAVKMILSGQFATKAELLRFRVEAEAAACLQHPNIVAIHQAGEVDGQPFIAMEYVRGRSLSERLRAGPLPPAQAAEYLQVIARAIQFAHDHGILHRDLKPANVLIDSSGQPRITDFGLAKRLDSDSHLTLSGAIMGTPSYMSPEQASAKAAAVGPPSDIYSLGAILYHMLAGRAPFKAESPEAVLGKVLDEEPVPPRLLNAGVPVDLDSICLKCLAKNRAERYSTARMLAEDLERYLDGQPVLARAATVTTFKELHWSDPVHAQQYLQEDHRYLPMRCELWRVLRSFYHYYLAGRRHLRVCDLGCGDGAIARQLLAVDDTIEFTLLDGSRQMLDAARRSVQGRSNIHFVQAAFDEIIRGEIKPGPFDAIVSGLAIHHLLQSEKAALFAKLIEQLQPGGWFVNMDFIYPDHSVFIDWQYELWRQQIIDAERDSPQFSYFHDAPERTRADSDNKPSPLGMQLKALRAVGFIEVDCHYRNGLFAMYTGRKP